MVTYSVENVKIAEEILKNAVEIYDNYTDNYCPIKTDQNEIREWSKTLEEPYKTVFRLSGIYYRPGDERVTTVWPTVETFLNKMDYTIFENYRKEKNKDYKFFIGKAIKEIIRSFMTEDMWSPYKTGIDLCRWVRKLPTHFRLILNAKPNCIFYHPPLNHFVLDCPSEDEVIDRLLADQIEEIVEYMKPKESDVDNPTQRCSDICENYVPMVSNTGYPCINYGSIGKSCYSDRKIFCTNYQPTYPRYIPGCGGDGNIS